MKNILLKMYTKVLLMSLVLLLLSVSCVKISLSDPDIKAGPKEPVEGKPVLIKINWEEMAGDNLPENLYVKVDTLTILLSRGEQPESLFLRYGDYTILVYNEPAGWTFNNELFTIQEIDGNINSGFEPLYSATKKFSVDDSAELFNFTILPSLNTGMIEFSFTWKDIPHDSILIYHGVLTNQARTYNLLDEKEEDAANMILKFKDSVCIIRTLGIISEKQEVILYFSSGLSEVLYSGRIDISDAIAGFNNNKHIQKRINLYYEDLYME